MVPQNHEEQEEEECKHPLRPVVGLPECLVETVAESRKPETPLQKYSDQEWPNTRKIYDLVEVSGQKYESEEHFLTSLGLHGRVASIVLIKPTSLDQRAQRVYQITEAITTVFWEAKLKVSTSLR